MTSSSLDLLEFESLKQLLGRYVRSALGMAMLNAVEPLQDRLGLEGVQSDNAEALRYLKSTYEPQPASRGAAIRVRFDALPDITDAARIVRIEGAVLEPLQIFELAQILEHAGEVRSILTAAHGSYPRLGSKAARLADLRPLLRELRGKILPDGSIADDASVALTHLRRDIEKQKRHIQESLERFLRAHREDGTLREDFITIREDRFVVPVIAGQERKVHGVIHGASGTGHTMFVEPLETIDLNNEAVRLREEEQREIHRILRDLTDRLRQHSGEIAATVSLLGELEFLFAKAQFAIDFSGIIPKFSTKSAPRLVLREARHPLLEDVLRRQGKTSVPISLALDEHNRTLLISGPNTGGKTVSMKTVGLLSLMAQAGLPVPAVEAEFPIFDRVLADIGDNQSIAESLSSFSSHIAHVRELLDLVTAESLVLLDELGRATDPEEGGALGVAILDTFRRASAFTLASTHLMALKIYGANTEGVVNGSMGFDEGTLQPTFLLRLGAPGKSAGLDIAKRLGLSEALIERARSSMTHHEQDLAKFLGELHERLAGIEKREIELAAKQAELAVREQNLATDWERRESAKLRELEKRCDAALAQFEGRAQEAIQKIEETAGQRKAAEKARQKLSQAKREFEHETAEAIHPEKAAEKTSKKIEEGARVRLRGIRQPAFVRRILSDQTFEVDAGLMKMQVSLDDIEEVLPATAESMRLPKNVSYQPGPAWDVSYREISVIGQRAEEARDLVDKFLDSAAMAAVDRVRIVHGYGMGILRKVIAELLAASPHVEKFYPAPPAEGGTGATIAELK